MRLDRPVSLLTQLSCFDGVKIILAQRIFACARFGSFFWTLWMVVSKSCWREELGEVGSNNGENTATPTGREEEPTWKTHQKSFRTKCVILAQHKTWYPCPLSRFLRAILKSRDLSVLAVRWNCWKLNSRVVSISSWVGIPSPTVRDEVGNSVQIST